MQRPIFLLLATVLVATGVLGPENQRAHAEDIAHVNPILNVALTQAHKRWRADAFVSDVEVQGSAQQHWLKLGLYSPSNGGMVWAEVGGPHNGSLQFGSARPQDPTKRAIPGNIGCDLPEAIAFARKDGWSGPLGMIDLRWVGATGTEPLLAWMISIPNGSPASTPLVISAETGAVIAQERAFDPH